MITHLLVLCVSCTKHHLVAKQNKAVADRASYIAATENTELGHLFCVQRTLFPNKDDRQNVRKDCSAP